MAITSSGDDVFLQDVVMPTAESLVTVDEDGAIRFLNRSAERLLGRDSDTLIDDPVAQLFGSHHDDPLETIRHVVDRNGQRARFRPPQVSLVHGDGHEIPVSISADQIEYEGTEYVTLTLRKASTQEQQTRKLDETQRLLRHVFDHSTEGIFVFDSARDDVLDCNARACELTGRSREEVLAGELASLFENDARFHELVEDAAESDETRRAELACSSAAGETIPVEVAASPIEIDGETRVVAYVTERNRETGGGASDRGVRGHSHGPRLEDLIEANRKLAKAQDEASIARVGVETIESVLGYDLGCVRLYDSESNTLDPVAVTDTVDALIESEPAFDLEETFAGQAYRRSEPIVREPNSASPYDSPTIKSSLHLPLGDHGTVTIASTTYDRVSERNLASAELLARNLTAALDRAEREGTLREQKQRLARRRDQLETVNQVNELVQTLIDELIDVDTCEEIEERVCTGLAESPLYRSAWIAELDVVGEEIVAKTGAGMDDDLLTAVDELPVGRIANGIVERALETGSVTIDRRYREMPDTESDDTSRTIEATAAVPLQYGEQPFGVLVVDAARENAFETAGRESLEVLGRTISFSINAIQNRELLLTDETVQLEFEVTDSDCLAVALSDALDCYCRIDRTVSSNEGDYLSYVWIEGESSEDALEAATAIDSVTESRVISEHDDGCILEVTRSECGATVMMEHGATMHTAEAESGTGTLIVETPRTTDVRRVANAYQQWNPDSTLVAKRDVERSVQTAREFREAIDDLLTEKQRSALTSAYYSGYYEWPRESTAEEIAESMGIASATLLQHLRGGHRKLLGTFLEDERRIEAP